MYVDFDDATMTLDDLCNDQSVRLMMWRLATTGMRVGWYDEL